MFRFIFRMPWTLMLNGQTIFMQTQAWKLEAWLWIPSFKGQKRFVTLVGIYIFGKQWKKLNITFASPGLAVNLSNSIPTTCINDLIADYNKKNAKNLPLLTYEKALTLVFNEIEALFERVQSGDLEYLYDMYYKCWLHRWNSILLSNSL